ncbi:hypothetical protein BGZ80_010136, partial [Entomortierella chlamydospora]
MPLVGLGPGGFSSKPESVEYSRDVVGLDVVSESLKDSSLSFLSVSGERLALDALDCWRVKGDVELANAGVVSAVVVAVVVGGDTAAIVACSISSTPFPDIVDINGDKGGKSGNKAGARLETGAGSDRGDCGRPRGETADVGSVDRS